MKYCSRSMYGLSVLCFCAALYFPSFSADTGTSDSLALLITGWFGFFLILVPHSHGFANPFYITSTIGMVRKKESNLLFILSLLSFLLAISFLGVKSIVEDASGHERLIISYGFGYWMWISAPFIMMVGQYIEIKRCEKLKNN